MIQRIQTVFLLLAAIILGLLFTSTFSFASVGVNLFGSDGLFNIYDHMAMTIINGIAASAFLIAIFLYKDRKQQRTLVLLATVLVLVLIGFGVYLWLDVSSVQGDITEQASAGIGVSNPVISLIFGLLALRFIKKDDLLVKSMDRLR
ncbi:MAG: DUF4293 domain-containing protein [Bacteroidia bacterium]|nr:DUF4293 domain-containing protein [Bacteroidia bacterium]